MKVFVLKACNSCNWGQGKYEPHLWSKKCYLVRFELLPLRHFYNFGHQTTWLVLVQSDPYNCFSKLLPLILNIFFIIFNLMCFTFTKITFESICPFKNKFKIRRYSIAELLYQARIGRLSFWLHFIYRISCTR